MQGLIRVSALTLTLAVAALGAWGSNPVNSQTPSVIARFAAAIERQYLQQTGWQDFAR